MLCEKKADDGVMLLTLVVYEFTSGCRLVRRVVFTDKLYVMFLLFAAFDSYDYSSQIKTTRARGLIIDE